ncbi:zinc-dependent alcohol dehydrogenase family protein [Rhizobium sp. LEGMi12c]
MKAICFTEKGVSGLADMPLPVLAPGHALIRVKAAGLCHTDIDVLHGRYGEGRFPLVPGHEYTGLVEAVAEDVTGLRPGARVAVDPNLPCGTCNLCRKGLTNLCKELKAYGVTQDGGFAEYSIVRVSHLHDIGDLSYDVAALAEPLACVLNGLGNIGLTTGIRRAESALVFGGGPIGLLLALSIRAQGVSDVVVADIDESRLSFARELRLDAVHPASPELQGRKRSFDLVADATGVPAVVENMPEFAQDGGAILVFGVCAPGVRVPISPFDIFRRQLTIAGSHSLNQNLPAALDLLRKDKGTMARLISHRLPLKEVLPFFTQKGGAPTMKVQFVAE